MDDAWPGSSRSSFNAFSLTGSTGFTSASLSPPRAARPRAGVDADVILITEKDAVKCRQIDHLKNDPRLWVVPVTAQLDPALAEQIVEKCRGRSLA